MSETAPRILTNSSTPLGGRTGLETRPTTRSLPLQSIERLQAPIGIKYGRRQLLSEA